jgi:hypothetical protein
MIAEGQERCSPGQECMYSRQKRLHKARIDAARARNVCSWPEKVAVGQDRCIPSQECMQLVRNDCRRPCRIDAARPGMYAAGQKWLQQAIGTISGRIPSALAISRCSSAVYSTFPSCIALSANESARPIGTRANERARADREIPAQLHPKFPPGPLLL